MGGVRGPVQGRRMWDLTVPHEAREVPHVALDTKGFVSYTEKVCRRKDVWEGVHEDNQEG